MERLALIGVSHRRGGAAALESWQSQLDEPAIMAKGFSGFVRIATCNRWDTLAVLPEGLSVEDARYLLSPAGQAVKPYAFVGDAALEQLTRIAASLDSLNPGEDQIMKQVRAAYQEAKAQGTTNKRVSFAFETALRIAKKVRRDIELAPMNTSLFSLARPTLEVQFAKGTKVAVLGAGSMGTLAAKSLVYLGYDVVIVNRSLERARQLAHHLGTSYESLEAFFMQAQDAKVLIAATPKKDIINDAVLKNLSKLELVVDLGIPRNVSAEAAKMRGIRVLDVDSLQSAGELRRGELSVKLAEAERIIQEELALALNDWAEKEIGPSIKLLRDWYVETIGDTLGTEDAQKLAHKFAHVPVKGLRAIAREYGVDAAKLFLEESGLSGKS